MGVTGYRLLGHVLLHLSLWCICQNVTTHSQHLFTVLYQYFKPICDVTKHINSGTTLPHVISPLCTMIAPVQPHVSLALNSHTWSISITSQLMLLMELFNPMTLYIKVGQACYISSYRTLAPLLAECLTTLVAITICYIDQFIIS